MSSDELRIFTPIGMLGYGFSEAIYWATMASGVDAVIVDAGSTDSGPSKLALGKSTSTRQTYKRDLDLLVAGCLVYKKPLLIGSAGGDGSTRGVNLFIDIIKEILTEKGSRQMRIISIHAEISKDIVRDHYQKGHIQPCGKAVPELQPQDIEDATRIVAQMGIEPWLKAMAEYPDFDIIVGGRSYDPSPYAAFCVHRGFTDLGIAYHMGKIMECGALCSVPKSKEALAIVRKDSFDIRALDPRSRCTPVSVAAHTLYEKTRPDILPGPGGNLHLENTKYEQLPDQRTVRVRGARFLPSKDGEYTIKLEAARQTGYHTMFIGGFTDRILINELDQFLDRAKAYVQEYCSFPFELEFRVYGNGAASIFPNITDTTTTTGSIPPNEIGIIGHARASTQEQASHVAHTARVYCVHAPYPGQRATAGNFAMPFAPLDIPLGATSEFCIYHTMRVEDPEKYFPIHAELLQANTNATPCLPPDQVHELNQAKKVEDSTLPEQIPNSNPLANNDQSGSVLGNINPSPGHTFLADIATVIRSKNAGPYELTFDVMFDKAETLSRVRQTHVLKAATIARLYGVPEDDVVACLWWEPALAFKATIKRPVVSGGFLDRDAHGSVQHMPLMLLEIPMVI
ncbi:hypothetical protein AbraIFM66951_007324 [Aspergillus brasiliensis]|uniref:Uncharacterized protein n=1 Tax=Aspergillus brasiliensis TaxID=319629 RepID=A0A9W6DNP3_9EURO|nr:hypothetical protein AbraCBS73388_007832 [Aspergillus brasiliensis]GKZ44979.1 hypothetical protein AbraIFM66951_007324 [Aspergillus brasiliensis]